MQDINDKLNQIEMLIKTGSIAQKKVLTLKEVSLFTGLSKSTIYKLTMSREIPFYKPTGKCLYFERSEIEEWLMTNRVATNREIESVAVNYCVKNKYK